MIYLTRIDGSPITVNDDEIETIETSFDSTITFVSGRKIVVKESSEIITAKVIEFRRSCIVPIK